MTHGCTSHKNFCVSDICHGKDVSTQAPGTSTLYIPCNESPVFYPTGIFFEHSPWLSMEGPVWELIKVSRQT